MKSSLKHLLTLIALGLAAAAPALLAQDMSTPPAPPPDAADAPPPPPSDQPPPPGRGGRPPMRGYNAKALADQLKLTDDQQQKVKGIMKAQRAKQKEIHDDTTLSDDDRRSKLMDLMKSTHDQIRAILNEDQQKQFDAMPMNRPRKKKADAT
jgi:Spy/CpxP family protein refolding chaperone